MQKEVSAGGFRANSLLFVFVIGVYVGWVCVLAVFLFLVDFGFCRCFDV